VIKRRRGAHRANHQVLDQLVEHCRIADQLAAQIL
jgi:hypothetical protein